MLRRVGETLPTIVGISGASFQVMHGLAQASMDAGAAGVMVAPPMGLRTDDQIFNYYGSVPKAIGSDVPVVYQDYPQSTDVYLSPNLFLRLVQAYPQIVMLKHEESPGAWQDLHNPKRVRAEGCSPREYSRRERRALLSARIATRR